MKFEILSHASLHVEHNGKSVLIDPWLRGSAYWRSWWNFPPVDHARIETLTPDFIYLTHIHWDHFHGPSLKAFSRATPILVTYDRYDRVVRDLTAMGFTNVTEIDHATPFILGDDFTLTPYLFSPFGDTVVVIESASTTLLNANDCKIVGLPLKQLLDNHPNIDFAFRSHSSANSRVLYELIGDGSKHNPQDNREDYLRSFANFMAAVKPRYAIPFASNHCHLHRETFRFNDWIVSPIEVRNFFQPYRQQHNLTSEIVTMLPGSTWDEAAGFSLADDRIFDDRASALKQLAQDHDATLQETYRREACIVLSQPEIDAYFQTVFTHGNWFIRRLFRDGPIIIRAHGGDDGGGDGGDGGNGENTASYWRVDVWKKQVTTASSGDFANADARITVPAMVLKHAMRTNMFGHVSISKRIKFQATAAGMKRLHRFELLLCFEEAEIIPLGRLLRWRVARSYMQRWREIVLYVQVASCDLVAVLDFNRLNRSCLQNKVSSVDERT